MPVAVLEVSETAEVSEADVESGSSRGAALDVSFSVVSGEKLPRICIDELTFGPSAAWRTGAQKRAITMANVYFTAYQQSANRFSGG
jgi:hypothetical protein